MKTNKEIIDSLQAYFHKECGSGDVARCLAQMMLDNHRIRNFVELTNPEQKSLIDRMRRNDVEFTRFVERGPDWGVSLEPMRPNE